MSLPFASLFPSRPEFFQTYDYFDIANGVGYDVYFGLSNAGTTATTTVSNNYSGMIHKNGSDVTLTVQGTEYEMLDFDWDITFNMPKNIRGDILVQIPYGMQKTNAANHRFIVKVTVDIYHWDGSSETQIGSTSTSELVERDLDNTEIGSHMTTLKVNAASVVHFKKGETLRFTIKEIIKCTDAANQTAVGGLGCDPQNRTDLKILLEPSDDTELQVIETNDPTQMAFHVPFVIPV